MNRDKLVAQYAEVFIGLITKRFEETGEVDAGLCDKVESLLWPSPKPREITHAYELEMES